MNFKKYCVTLCGGVCGMRDVDMFARNTTELKNLIDQILIRGEEVFIVSMYISDDVLEFVQNYL